MSNIGPVGGSQGFSSPNLPLAEAKLEAKNLQNAINQLNQDESSGNEGAVQKDLDKIEKCLKNLRTTMNNMGNQFTPEMKALNEQYNNLSNAYAQFNQNPSEQSLLNFRDYSIVFSETLNHM